MFVGAPVSEIPPPRVRTASATGAAMSSPSRVVSPSAVPPRVVPPSPSPGPFAHLHCHSHYSLLDGAAKVPDLVAQAKSLGMNSLALTDHGNLYGAVEFYNACRAQDMNPVIGYEAYVAPGHRGDRQTRGEVGGEASFHLTMLAQNRTGFRNLVKLASYAYTEGFYYKPRIDKELIEAHSEGLIVLSGCASSEFSKFILGEKKSEALRLAEWFAKLLGDRFFVEIQDNGLQLQKDCAAGAIEVADRLGLPLVATCDTHYLCGHDSEAHEVLLCINTGKTMKDPNRMQYGSDEFYLKSPAEMYQSFAGRPEAVTMAQTIADTVDIDLDFSARHFPVFAPPEQKSDKDYLLELCERGLETRYGDAGPERRQAARERLDMELGVINKLGFASYFLIVWDFVNFANERGIPCGARGSACGAIVSYLLGFSDVCPIEYDLLFERFLDPNRAEAPDIDIDFCQQRREEVIEYTRQKYGEKNVAQIITFGTMAARAVIRDVGRALEMELPKVDRIAKLVPQVLKITLADALKQSPDLKREYDRDQEVRRLIDIGMRLEGLARNPGTHAAGVVVADQDLTEYIPLQKNGELVTTQWEMAILEQVGMLKFDFLGLRNLTILTAAVQIIRNTRDADFDLRKLPLDDPDSYTLMQRGETKGVFQFESEGIRNLLTRLRPDRFEDIIATAALYRPGPLGGGMVDDYIDVKHGRKKPHYEHAVMEDVLEETYGVMVYQEQVMRILNRLGDIPLREAYACIKAISKKKLKVIAAFKEQFVKGSGEKGMEKKKAEEIFNLIEQFAGYGFNKSHSTAYALVAYHTAYLKAHYPAEFMAALMSSELDKTDLLVEHLDDSKRMGIEVRPPDINEGEVGFTVKNDKIYFGLAAIKGAGSKAIRTISDERKKTGPYRNLFDFCERIDTTLVNKTCLEALVKAGALDSLKAHRAQLMAALPSALQAGSTARDARTSGQGLLFAGEDDDTAADVINTALPDVAEWTDQDLLAHEKGVLGVYLSSHPLSEHQRLLRIFQSHEVRDLEALPDRAEVIVGGMVSGLRVMVQQRGRNAGSQYARFQFEDLTGQIGCVMFADAWVAASEDVTDDAVIFLHAQVDKSRDLGLIAVEPVRLEDAPRALSGSLVVKLPGDAYERNLVPCLASLLRSRPGSSPVFLEVRDASGLRVRMKAGDGLTVACDTEIAGQLEALVGRGNVQIRPTTQRRQTRVADAPRRFGRKAAG